MVKVEQITLLYSLFFKSSNKIFKYSMMFLPIVIAFSFSAILFINNLSYSYKNYLLKSYIGTQGVLSIKANDTNYLKHLQKTLDLDGIVSSLKKELRVYISLKTSDMVLEKRLRFIVLEDKYIKDKFGLSSKLIVCNKILKNSLGDIKQLYIKKTEATHYVDISNIKVVDTGFLVSEPLIFVGKSFLDKLGIELKAFNTLEINTQLDKIQNITNIALKLSEKYACDITTNNVLTHNQQTKEMFDNIEYIEYVVLIITVVLAFIILSGALSIISQIKQKAISLLRIYGLSTNLISTSLTLLSFVLLFLSIFIAYILYIFMKIYFLSRLGLGDDFFLSLNIEVYYIILSIFMVFCLVTYVWSNNKFKGKIEL